MAAFTVYEQLLLELMNRARLDPLGEAARLGIDLNKGLAAGTITAATKQALAPNNALETAAAGHSQFMINVDQFAHSGIGDFDPTKRMTNAGYALTGTWMTGENIAWVGTTGAVDMLTFTKQIADNLFISPLHRENTLNGSFREAGTGVKSGAFASGGTTYNAVMATENFGLSGSKVFVSGVAINDTNGNNFYDVGEARGNLNVSVTTVGVLDGTDITEAAGGYSVATATGTHVVTFSGSGLAAPVSATVYGGTSNVKIDLAGASKVLSSVTTTLGAGAHDLTLLGAVVANGYGNALNNIMTGSKAANMLSGGLGNDTLDGGAGNDVLVGGAGNDIFVFNTALSATLNKDTITDFSAAAVGNNDVIKLENSGIFATLTALGALNVAFFKANATGVATDADDHIIYNTTTGALFYDTNGSTAGGVTQFATLGTTTHPTITAADFFVI